MMGTHKQQANWHDAQTEVCCCLSCDAAGTQLAGALASLSVIAAGALFATLAAALDAGVALAADTTAPCVTCRCGTLASCRALMTQAQSDLSSNNVVNSQQHQLQVPVAEQVFPCIHGCSDPEVTKPLAQHLVGLPN